jgi:hypothetical protein
MANTLIPPKAPNLPVASGDYSRIYQDQIMNILRLYFNQIDNFAQPLSTGTGGSNIRFPYFAISSGVTQTAATNTATALTYNTTDFSNGFTLVSGTKITPGYAGIYNLQFSVQLQNLSNGSEDVYIWLRQNGVDIAGSTGIVGLIARKSAGVPSHGIYGWNYYVSMNVGDYLEIWWSTTDGTNVSIPYYAASGSPTKPATQSVVATMSFISGL